MTLQMDFQTFYREMFGVMEFEEEHLNEDGIAARVTTMHDDIFYIYECEESAKKLNGAFPCSSYVIFSYAADGHTVSYDALVEREKGRLFSCTVIFYPDLKMVNVGFKHFDSRSGTRNEVSPTIAKGLAFSLGDIAAFMIRNMLEVHPKCRLHFASNEIEVKGVNGIPIPGYVE